MYLFQQIQLVFEDLLRKVSLYLERGSFHVVQYNAVTITARNNFQSIRKKIDLTELYIIETLMSLSLEISKTSSRHMHILEEKRGEGEAERNDRENERQKIGILIPGRPMLLSH